MVDCSITTWWEQFSITEGKAEESRSNGLKNIINDNILTLTIPSLQEVMAAKDDSTFYYSCAGPIISCNIRISPDT